MSLLITRAAGDTTAIKIKWSGDVDFSAVTAIAMKVYDTKSKDTLLVTIPGEVRGFDPFTYIPMEDDGAQPVDTSWTGTRYFQFELTIGTAPDDETKPLPDIGLWTNT